MPADHEGRARPRLDRETIVTAALKTLDEVGLDALTTRLLADRLGVKSPALYWHFASKTSLVAAMSEAILAEDDRPEPPEPGGDVEQWLISVGQTFRHALLRHRDGGRVHAGTVPSAAQLPTVEAQIRALTEAGLAPVAAARAALAVSRFTVGWVLEEQSTDETGQPTPDIDGYPLLAAAQHELAHSDPDDNYDFGLRCLVRGLLAEAHPTRSGAGSPASRSGSRRRSAR